MEHVYIFAREYHRLTFKGGVTTATPIDMLAQRFSRELNDFVEARKEAGEVWQAEGGVSLLIENSLAYFAQTLVKEEKQVSLIDTES